MEIVHRVSYKDTEAEVILRDPPQKADILIRSWPPTRIVLQELLLILAVMPTMYKETRLLPTIEDARRRAAVDCLTEERYGDIAGLTATDLAKLVGVTEEFAQFRIRLARAQQES